MKYLLLAATVVALSLTACDQFREKTAESGKFGQYPPSQWDKRDSAPPGPDDAAGDGDKRHEAPVE